MARLSRRQFLSRTAATVATVGLFDAGVTRLRANPLGLPIGSQTYPHRALIRDGKFADLLNTFRQIGVEKIELMSALAWKDFAPLRDGRQTKKIIEDHGLKCESTQFRIDELRQDQAASIAWAHDLGLKYMIVPTLSPTLPRTTDDVKRAAEEYNKIATVAMKAGIQQGLHNEETFENVMIDGRRVYDMLFELLDPKLVKFEFQMSSLNSGMVGADYFRKYPGRFVSMHLQDIDRNAPLDPPTQDGRRRYPQAPLGKGSIDWVKTFKAAKTGGVKMYYVEQTMEFTRESVAFLKTLNV
jgi:sugar phosphate isomerase/epimerase